MLETRSLGKSGNLNLRAVFIRHFLYDPHIKEVTTTARRRKIPKDQIFLGGEDEAAYIANFTEALRAHVTGDTSSNATVYHHLHEITHCRRTLVRQFAVPFTDQSRADGIEMDAIHHAAEIIPVRIAPAHRHRFVTTLEHMPLASPHAIPALAVNFE